MGLFKRRTKEKKKESDNESDRLKKTYKINEERLNQQVERNLNGIKLEKEGKLNEAIKLYELNVNENCEGNHPYDRLAIIYRKLGRIEDEIRVLEKAIWVFENIVNKERADRLPKLQKFREQLEKAKKIRQKQFKG